MTRIISLRRFLTSIRWVADPVAMPAPHCSRQTVARASLGWGLLAFLLATVTLAGTLETVKPEWRDPEYGVRLQQLRRWRALAPDRPLVVFFGSSRTQMGIAPAAMGFPDEPGSPLVYNFGYRAAHPFRACFQLTRLLNDGIKPDFVVLQLASNELAAADRSQYIRDDWAGRLSARDLEQLKSCGSDIGSLLGSWVKARMNGWSESGKLIISDQLPDWHAHSVRLHYSWERTDRFGFTPHHIEKLTSDQRQGLIAWARKQHGPALAKGILNATADRAIRELVARCRAEGIAVALFWAPESAPYRSFYSARARATEAEYEKVLAAELGVLIFPAPGDMTDTDFLDGLHLLRHGAERYSRWLADTHLRPWLARHPR